MTEVSLEQLSEQLGANRLKLNDHSADSAEREIAGTCILAWVFLATDRSSLADDELDEVIVVCREVSQSLPAQWTFQPSVRSVLSHSLRIRFEQHGRPDDLEEALELAEQDFVNEPEGSDEQVSLALNFSSLLDHKWGLTGDTGLLDKSLSLSRWAVDTAAPGSADLARARNNLGRALGRRFERLGDLDDLIAAINTLDVALDEAPPAWDERWATLSGLGHWLRIQYTATGRMSDLDRSIEVHREALAGLGVGNHGRRLALTNLAAALDYRGDYPDHENDRTEARALNEAAVNLTPADHPNRAGYLNNLATSLGRQWRRQRDPDLLDRAIALLEEAIAAPGQVAARGLWLSNLAAYLLHRYELATDVADLEQAELNAKSALVVTEDGDPGKGHRLAVLARILTATAGSNRSQEDAHEIAEAFRAAADAASPLHTEVLPLSYEWCRFAQEAGDTESASEAARIALEALKRFA